LTLLAVAVGGRGAVDPDEPVLHADDQALLRGRAAFETTRVYAGRPFKLDEHIARLAGSAARLGLPQVDLDEFESLARTAIGTADAEDAVLRIFWTAGRENADRPTALALVSTIPPELEDKRARGIKLVSLPLGVLPDVRAVSPWLLGGVKSTSYAVNMSAEAEAQRRGADDAVFLAADGTVLEGPVTNVWWRLERVLYTPALELGILAGVTRATLIEEGARLGYEVREGVFPIEHMRGAEEAFTSSSIREVMPVVELDGAPLGTGEPGSTARELQGRLHAVVFEISSSP
jgi:4-amino-4-deoxychorismate lyase